MSDKDIHIYIYISMLMISYVVSYVSDVSHKEYSNIGHAGLYCNISDYFE